MVESQRFYFCDNKRCAWEFPVYADVDRAYGIDEPKGCPQSGCNSPRCNPMPEKSVCRDCQELRLQEHVSIQGERERASRNGSTVVIVIVIFIS